MGSTLPPVSSSFSCAFQAEFLVEDVEMIMRNVCENYSSRDCISADISWVAPHPPPPPPGALGVAGFTANFTGTYIQCSQSEWLGE